MKKHVDDWAKIVAKIIYTIHNTRPKDIDDLINCEGDGWNHNDFCNNMIVDKKTKKIIGLIDWEYAGWGTLKTEIDNTDRFSKKLKKLSFSKKIEQEYNKIESI
ncbi:MAG: aminoglycoside phosphotransferase family protein [Alphaproteobacteria bacterium]|nr:aminoglycoside phosphotransferase family protein [Alphaproteobacteria bacterium]